MRKNLGKRWLNATPTDDDADHARRSRPRHRVRSPVLRFVVLLTLFTLVFNAFFYLFVANSRAYYRYLHWNAAASAAVMRLFGEDVAASDTLVGSPRNSVDVRSGCDAVQVTAFFVFGVLASPIAVSRMNRMLVALGGTLFLLLVNLARIISLYYTGLYAPSMSDMMHVDIWQPAFIFLTVFLWLAWIWYSLRSDSGGAHADG